jgi:DNA-binding IclR family transcriptional regulator
MGKDTRGGVKAVESAARILAVLASAQKPLALRELATAGRMSPGKVHRYLASFLSSDLASQDLGTRRYSLGPLALRLGLAALNSHQPLHEAILLQRELRNYLDETMVLSVWGTQGPTVVNVEESSQPIIMTMRIGAVLPMLATATGLVFAAFLPRHITEELIEASSKAEDGLNVFARDAASIDRLIDEVRKQGYAFNEGHLMPGVSALAFPLIDRLSNFVAVIAVMGRHERLKPRKGAEMLAYLKRAADGFGQ